MNSFIVTIDLVGWNKEHYLLSGCWLTCNCQFHLKICSYASSVEKDAGQVIGQHDWFTRSGLINKRLEAQKVLKTYHWFLIAQILDVTASVYSFQDCLYNLVWHIIRSAWWRLSGRIAYVWTFITARKRSLHCMLGYTPLWADTLWADTPWADTPLSRHLSV